MKLPKRSNKLGYTFSEIMEMLSVVEYLKFCIWMNGKKCVIRDGMPLCAVNDLKRFLEVIGQGEPNAKHA